MTLWLSYNILVYLYLYGGLPFVDGLKSISNHDTKSDGVIIPAKHKQGTSRAQAGHKQGTSRAHGVHNEGTAGFMKRSCWAHDCT